MTAVAAVAIAIGFKVVTTEEDGPLSRPNGGWTSYRPVATAAATAPLELEQLPAGPLPGKRIPGQFRGESVRDVRELAVTGGAASEPHC